MAAVLTLLAAVLAAHPCVGWSQGDDGEAVPCEPAIADNCWGDVAASVDCLLDPRSARAHSQQCRRQNATELCRVLEDALRCSSELVDSGCALQSGRENFDFWMRGLEAVNTKLCFEGLMENIVSHAICWDGMRFWRCVQHSMPRLQHLVDLGELLAAAAQAHEPHGVEHCYLAMLRMSKCGALAAALDPAPDVPPPPEHHPDAPYSFCGQAPPVDLINDLLAAYFSASECGGSGGSAASCPPPPQPPRPEELPPPPPPAPAPAPTAPTPEPDEDEEPAAAPTERLLPLCTSPSSSAASAAPRWMLVLVVTLSVIGIKLS